MAEKRMFTMKIIDSDSFKEMPLSTQALYFHLGMNADDEGFLNNAKSVQRSIMASDDDMKLLIAKNFIIPFASGVVVIKHWKMHNSIQPSKLKPTQYTEEKSLLSVKENKAYTLNVNNLSTNCRQTDDKCRQNDAEIRLDKIRLDKISIEEDIGEEPTPKTKHKYGEFNNVLLSDEELEKLKTSYPDYQERIELLSGYIASTGKSYKSHYATILNWARKDKQQPRATGIHNFQERQYTDADYAALEKKMFNRQLTVADDP